MKLSAVILNYNDYRHTAEQLQRLLHYEILDDIVLVDNCSTDDSAAQLKALLPKSPGPISSGPGKTAATVRATTPASAMPFTAAGPATFWWRTRIRYFPRTCCRRCFRPLRTARSWASPVP